MKKTVLLGSFIMILFSCSNEPCSLLPIPGQPAGEETYGGYALGLNVGGDIPANYKYPYTACLNTMSFPLTDITMTVALPPEVELINGSLNWKGNLSPNNEKCLRVTFLSKKDWQEWSKPVHAHVEFIYEGEKVIGDINWSYEDYVKRTVTVWKHPDRLQKQSPDSKKK